MAVNATVNAPRTTLANLSQANTSQVVRVTVPGSSSVGSFAQDRQQEVVRVSVPGLQGAEGAQGPAGADGADGADGPSGVGALGDLTDVDITNPADGSLIQYSASTTKWTNQTDISDLGTITINGGNF